MLKKSLLFLGLVTIVFLSVLAVNFYSLKSKQLDVKYIGEELKVNNSMIENLSKAIQIKTISYDDESKIDYSKFKKFQSHLLKSYPLVDSILDVSTFNYYSMIFHWKGKSNKTPYLLTAHLDVVPVENESDWQYPPFEGRVVDGSIWGRGTLDDKISVISILESIEALLKEGFVPERDIYLVFGHDEEATGKKGAAEMAKYFAREGIRFEAVLDEGLVVTRKMVPGIEKDVALIGVAEKGYLTFKLTSKKSGGHSSMPSANSSIYELNEALYKLKNNPLPSKLSAPLEGFIEYLGPEMPFVLRLAFSNTWLFKDIIIGEYEKSNSGKALVNTTFAPTVFNAGFKENVIPQQAQLTVNVRILPGTSVDDIKSHIISTIDNPSIELEILDAYSEATPTSSFDTRAFYAIHRSVKEVFENTLVSPSLMIATADARHYEGVADNVYRFLPVVLDSEAIEGIHGSNERISIKSYEKAINFYYRFLKNID
jgi:carboxypeptidase PM20D1